MAPLHTVTTAELRAALTEAERGALPESVGGVQLEAWLGELLGQACDRVVGAVNSCERNVRIRTGLCRVPAECVRTVLVLARHAAVSAIPGMAANLGDGPRAAEYATAVQDLAALAACDLLPSYELCADEAADDELLCGVQVLGEEANDWLI